MKFKDQLHRTIHLEKTPIRIVSLVPSQTELLCDLGLEFVIVGMTKFCVHPSHLLKEKTIVGGTKQVHFDRIKALNPDIILCNKEENTREIVTTCEAICLVHVSDVVTINDSLDLIKQYGVLFNKRYESEILQKRIKKEQNAFKAFIKDKTPLKTVYFIWKKPWMIAANDTFINHLLNLNKFENAYKHIQRYPEIELSNLYKDDTVTLVLLSSEPYPFKEAHKKELKMYYPQATIKLVDGEMFSWFGSRLTLAFSYFKNLQINLRNNQPY